MNTLIKLIALFFFISVAFGEFQLMKKSRGYSEAVDYLTLKIKKTTCAEFLKKGGLGDRIRGGYSHHCLPVSSKGEDVDDLKFIGRCLNHDKDIILSIIEIHGKKSSDKNDKHNDDEKKYEKKGKIARSFTTREENDEKQFYLRLQAKEEPIEFKIKHFNLKNGHAYQVRRPACIKAKNHCETSKRSAEEMMVIDCLPRKQSKGKVEKDETVYIEITRRDERPDTCKDAKNGYCCRYVSASKNQGICKLYKSKGGRKDSNKGEGNKGQEYKGEGPVTGVLGKLGQKPKDDAPGAEGNSYGETKPTEEKDIAIEYNAEEETKHQEESKHEDKAEPKKEDDDEKRSLIKKTVEVPKSVAEVKSDEGEEFEIEDEEDPFKDEEKKDVAAPTTPVVEMKKVVAATESKDEIVQRSKKDILPLETKKESIEPVKKDAIEPVKVIEPIKKDAIEPVKAAVEQTTVLEMNQVENVPETNEEVKSTIAKRDVIVGNKAKKEEDDFDLWSEINDDKSTLEEEEEKEKEEEKAKENKKESQSKKTSDNKKEEEEEEKEEKEKEEKEKLAEKQKEEDDEKKRNAEQKKSLGKTQQASAQENKKEEKPVAKEEKKQEAPAAKKEENKKQEATPKKEKSEEEEEKDEKEREMKEKEEDEKDKKEEEEEREREEKEEKEDKEKEEEEEREDKMKKEGSEEEEEEEQKKKEEEEEEKRNIKASPAKSADASTTNVKSNSAPSTPVKNAPVVIDSKQLLDEAEKEMADEFAKKK